MAINRTPVVENPGSVEVNVTKFEYLHFTVTVGGPRPIFTFSGKSHEVQASDFPNDQKIFEWDHLKKPEEHEQLGLLAIQLSFFANKAYEYKVELRDRDDKPVNTSMDIQYTGDPLDTAPESFNVMLV